MLSEANIWIFLFSILPGLIYSFIVYLHTPNKAVRIKTALNYLFIGFLSAMFVLGFHLLFPNWMSPLFMTSYTLIPTVLTFFIQAFFQIALIEELAKWSAFRISQSTRHGYHKKDSPLGTMFYAMMISTGFAILENVLYGYQYGEDIIVIRSFTALVMHMALGIIMGYFIAIGRQQTEIKNKTVLEVFFKTHTRWKRVVYNVFGILAAVAIHGLYDWNLIASHDNKAIFSVGIITATLILAYQLGKKLLTIHNRNKEIENRNKELQK